MGLSVVSVLFAVRLVGASVGLPVDGSDMYKSRRKLGLPVLYVKKTCAQAQITEEGEVDKLSGKGVSNGDVAKSLTVEINRQYFGSFKAWIVLLISEYNTATVMGLCKCPKKKVTNQFCFEHRVNVCEYCLVSSHPRVRISCVLVIFAYQSLTFVDRE